MAQVSQNIEIKASPKQCYDVIVDYKSYPDFLKEIKGIKVEKKTAQISEVTFSIEMIKKISYTLEMQGKPSKKVSWSLIEGDLMKKNSGEWILEEVSKGVTQATYNVDVELKLFVPGPISKMLIGSSLPGMLKSFKERIEKKNK